VRLASTIGYPLLVGDEPCYAQDRKPAVSVRTGKQVGEGHFYTARVTRDRGSPESSAQHSSALQRTQVRAFTPYGQVLTELNLVSLSETMGAFTYLEIAPPSPTFMSLSYTLYLRGSRGVLSNLTPPLCDLARRSRPLDTCLPHEPDPEVLEHVTQYPNLIIIHSDTITTSLNILSHYSNIDWTIIVLKTTQPDNYIQDTDVFSSDSYTLTRFSKYTYLLTSKTIQDKIIRMPEALSDTPTVSPASAPLLTGSRVTASSIAPLLPIAHLKLIPHNAHLDELKRQLVEYATIINGLESSINALLESHSWRVTRHLRSANKALTLLKSRLHK
jgi:hypothetical protein